MFKVLSYQSICLKIRNTKTLPIDDKKKDQGLFTIYRNVILCFCMCKCFAYLQSVKGDGFVCLHSLYWLKFQDKTYIAWMKGLTDQVHVQGNMS